MPLPIYVATTDETAEYIGTAEDIAAIQQFARDYPWEVAITDPEYAADEVLSELRNGEQRHDLHPDAEARLRAALVDSARASLSAIDAALVLYDGSDTDREHLDSYADDLASEDGTPPQTVDEVLAEVRESLRDDDVGELHPGAEAYLRAALVTARDRETPPAPPAA